MFIFEKLQQVKNFRSNAEKRHSVCKKRVEYQMKFACKNIPQHLCLNIQYDRAAEHTTM